MSKIGYIQNSYGSSFNVAIANTYSENVLNASKLPANTFIIAAPFDNEELEDIGTYSLILTDSYGTPARITYCIKEGNGFYNEDEHLYVHIDNVSLIEENNMLNVNLSNIILDNSININNGKLSANIDYIDKTTQNEVGTVKVDGKTIQSDNGTIYVDTAKLDLATNSMYGIAIGDEKTIKTDHGKTSVKVDGLTNGTDSNYGIVKADGISITSNAGILSLNKSYFINDSSIGTIKPDDSTIKSLNGILSINSEGLTKASTMTAGTVSLGNEFITNANGQTSVIVESNAPADVNAIRQRMSALNTRLDSIEEILA